MAHSDIVIRDFIDKRFQTTFKAYLAELVNKVKDWDGVFAFMNKGEEQLQLSGCHRIALTTHTAAAFYEKNGYHHTSSMKAPNSQPVYIKIFH